MHSVTKTSPHSPSQQQLSFLVTVNLCPITHPQNGGERGVLISGGGGLILNFSDRRGAYLKGATTLKQK